jgi:hypothetical protein
VNDRVDAVPKLHRTISHGNETLGAPETILEIVVEGDRVEHP